MANKKTNKIKGFSLQFLPHSEIRVLGSSGRIRKIINSVLKNNIVILQGRLGVDEETKLIESSMELVGKIKNFKGIELAVISGSAQGFLQKFKKGLIKFIFGGEIGALSVIGPASIVKDIKRNPKKLELYLNK
jgi:hypothetical protein